MGLSRRAWLEHHQVAIYFTAAAVGAVAGMAAPADAGSLEALITPAIAVLMYAMFLQIPFLGLRAALGNHRFIGALLLANFVLVPLLVWGLTLPLAGQGALLVGALLVLLTPCIDYVVVFTHLGRGDARLVLSATPLLLVLQFALLPLYLALMLGGEGGPPIAFAPFLQAFVLLIVLPLMLAVLTEALGRRSAGVQLWQRGWLWLPVPAMALVLLLVVGSQVAAVARDAAGLLPVLAVYVAFAVLAPMAGVVAARLWRLPAPAARAVVFSSATRNSLVVLPLALALPDDLRTLAATAVVTQTLVELLAELVYIRAVPRLVPGALGSLP